MFPGKSQDPSHIEESRSSRQTHIDVQDLVGGPFGQEGLPSSARDLVGALVGEHGSSTLVFPRPVNGPVSVDDGSAGATPQGWREHEKRRMGKRCLCPPVPTVAGGVGSFTLFSQPWAGSMGVLHLSQAPRAHARGLLIVSVSLLPPVDLA